MNNKNFKPLRLPTLFLSLLLYSNVSFSQESFQSKLMSIFSSRPGSKAVLQTENKDLTKFSQSNQCPQHYPWGFINIIDKTINSRSLYLCRDFFAIQYDKEFKIPLWTSEEFNKNNLDTNISDNNIKINLDEDLPSIIQQKPEDYLKTNYLPIQLASHKKIFKNNSQTEDLKNKNLIAISQSKKFSNTVPMIYNNLANTVWKDLEEQTINMAINSEKLYVITGVIYLNGKTNGKLKYSETPIPTHFYKILVNPINYKNISYIIPNQEILTSRTKNTDNYDNFYKCNNSKCELSNFSVSVKEVERVTGIKIFPLISTSQEILLQQNFLNKK